MQRFVSVAVALLALLAPHPSSAETVGAGREVVLDLPRPIRPGETAFVEIDVGAVARGAQIALSSGTGRELGVVSPFGARPGQDAGRFTVPVPSDAIRDGRIVVRVTIRHGDTRRAPTDREVRGLTVNIAGGSR
jgi:hypothetical protein